MTALKRNTIALIMLYSVAGAVCLIALMWLLTPKLLQFQEDFIGTRPVPE